MWVITSFAKRQYFHLLTFNLLKVKLKKSGIILYFITKHLPYIILYNGDKKATNYNNSLNFFLNILRVTGNW